ncbi:MAG: hypothetical protein R6X14_10410 [bacterium]
MLRRAQQPGPACPTGPTRPTGPTPEPARALVLSHAFELLAAKLPALYETLPWFDWDSLAATRGQPLWRTRLLLAGDGATVVAARCRRAGGVRLVEPRDRPADYARRKLRLVGVRRFQVSPGPFEDVIRAGGFDLALLALPLPHGPEPDRLFALLAGPAFVLALRPGAEEGIAPPSGWQAVTVRTAAGPRPGWMRPGS